MYSFYCGIMYGLYKRPYVEQKNLYVCSICMEQFCVGPVPESVRRPVWQFGFCLWRPPEVSTNKSQTAKPGEAKKIITNSDWFAFGSLAVWQSRKCLQYLSSIYGELNIKRGNQHTYIRMEFIFPGDGTVQIDMSSYLKESIEEFLEVLSKIVTSPALNHIFDINLECPKLSEEKKSFSTIQLQSYCLFISTHEHG